MINTITKEEDNSMSDNTSNKFQLLNAEIPESIDNAVKNLTDLPSKSVGQTLSDCWFLVFGGFSHLAEKRKIKYANDLEEFKQSLCNKVSSIPEENRTEANTQLVMPALENAKYCVEEKDIREMFANLIAASLDSELQSSVHPVFAEILKTLTPLDAKNLLLIEKHVHLPICDIIHIPKENLGSYSVLLQNLFLMNPECQIYEQQAVSISSLQKQGLIEISDRTIFEPHAYSAYEKCDELSQIRNTYPGLEIALEKKLVRLTPLGHSFLNVCCPD